jgi:hypothetical protein
MTISVSLLAASIAALFLSPPPLPAPRVGGSELAYWRTLDNRALLLVYGDGHVATLPLDGTSLSSAFVVPRFDYGTCDLIGVPRDPPRLVVSREDHDGRRLDIYGLPHGELAGTLTLPKGVGARAISSKGDEAGTVFFVSLTADRAYIVDSITPKVLTTVKLPVTCNGAALSPEGSRIAEMNGTEISVREIVSGKQVWSTSVASRERLEPVSLSCVQSPLFLVYAEQKSCVLAFEFGGKNPVWEHPTQNATDVLAISASGSRQVVQNSSAIVELLSLPKADRLVLGTKLRHIEAQFTPDETRVILMPAFEEVVDSGQAGVLRRSTERAEVFDTKTGFKLSEVRVR